MSEVLQQELICLSIYPGAPIGLAGPLQHIRNVVLIQSLNDRILTILGQNIQVEESSNLIELHGVPDSVSDLNMLVIN